MLCLGSAPACDYCLDRWICVRGVCVSGVDLPVSVDFLRPRPTPDFPSDLLAHADALCKSIVGQNREDGNEITHAFYEASWDLVPALVAEIKRLQADLDCRDERYCSIWEKAKEDLAINDVEIKKLREMISESETNYKFYDKIIGEQESELSGSYLREQAARNALNMWIKKNCFAEKDRQLAAKDAEIKSLQVTLKYIDNLKSRYGILIRDHARDKIAKDARIAELEQIAIEERALRWAQSPPDKPPWYNGLPNQAFFREKAAKELSLEGGYVQRLEQAFLAHETNLNELANIGPEKSIELAQAALAKIPEGM